ncbi:MAG: hypothetical protein COT22_07280 [Ignavibacteria bacterium CG08_land_8_20_14_0_20_37_9]|nr:MAG: hypothetical protein COT22_07280 [Ignavibacteria bacterium CG08_land_8_20_14_0_20_37_9]
MILRESQQDDFEFARLSNNRGFIFFASLILGVSTYLYIDHLAFTSAGLVISYLIFFTNLCVSLYRLSWGIVLTLFLGFFIVDYPRDILNLYTELQVEKSTNFYVLGSVTISKLTLLNILFIVNTLLAGYRLIIVRVKGRFGFLGFALLLFAIGCTSLLYSIVSQEVHSMKAIATDLKFPAFLVFGFIQGLYLVRVNAFGLLLEMLILLPFFIGIRAIIFMVSDIYFLTPSFYFATNTTISVSVLAYLIASKSYSIYSSWVFRLGLYVSLLEPSRSFLLILSLILGISLFMSVFLLREKGMTKSAKTHYVSELLFIGFMLLFIVGLYNPVVYDFIAWKLNVFNEILSSDQQLSESGGLRLYELMNVSAELSDSIYQMLFGKGFGGAYTFNTFPFNSADPLDLKSYSEDQLQSGIYYATHSFSAYMLLKYGLIGLGIYLLIPLLIVFKAFKSLKYHKVHFLLLFLSAISLYYYYWRLDLAFLMSALWAYFYSSKFRAYPVAAPQALYVVVENVA